MTSVLFNGEIKVINVLFNLKKAGKAGEEEKMNFKKNWHKIVPFIKNWSPRLGRSLGFGVGIFILTNCVFILANWRAESLRLFTDERLSLFFGSFAIYMWLGGEIINQSKDDDFNCNFSAVNLVIGLAMFLCSLLGIAFFPLILLLTWPLTVAGVILFVAAVIVLFKSLIASYSSYELE